MKHLKETKKVGTQKVFQSLQNCQIDRRYEARPLFIFFVQIIAVRSTRAIARATFISNFDVECQYLANFKTNIPCLLHGKEVL